MPQSYDIGDLVELGDEVRNRAGTLVTPTNIVLRVKAPSGTVTEYAPDADSTGIYHHDLLIVEAGDYVYRWTTTDPTMSDERVIHVRERRVP